MKKVLIIAIGLIFLIGCTNKKSESESDNKCKTTEDYQCGYKAGHGQAVLVATGTGGTSSCDVYLESVNNGYGTLGTVSDCFRQGFYDGYKEAK